MSVYCTVPNSNIFFKQANSNNNNDPTIRMDSTLDREVHEALTPPNTPTHGIIITSGPNDFFDDLMDPIDGDDDDADQKLLDPKKVNLIMNSDSVQSTPSDLRSMCGTPDSDWQIPQLSNSMGPNWNDMNMQSKLRYVMIILLKIFSLFFLLYIFICSLDLLSTSFRLLGARVIGNFFTDNALLQNPVVGLMIGVLVTVLVQSSSTSTSIAVTMVASGIIHVRQAVPIMMGANIGTSVTNTIVSLMQSADRQEFGRAFAAATVHDMFNWLTVIILLPLEVTTRYLERLTTYVMQWSTAVGDDSQKDQSANHQFLNHLTKPLTNRIIKIDSKLVEEMAYGNWSNNDDNGPPVHVLIRCCTKSNSTKCNANPNDSCSLFGWLAFADTPTGLILLIISILVLCLCLMMLVKVLNSMLTGQIARLIKHTMNRSYAFPYSILADYLAILVGCILTILVQSSSIFTSALTPLAGIGVISLERIYPLTLGANIGTTTTGMLAAVATDTKRIHETMQIALCHLFFNITGILLFYPVPCMRIPIPLARMLGNITANYRWFSIFYLLVMFFILPLIVFSLSTLGPTAMSLVGGPCLLIALTIILINLIQLYRIHWLPTWLQNWHWLPIWMRSLDPLDRFIMRTSRRFGCTNCCALANASFEKAHDSIVLSSQNDAHHSTLHILSAMDKCNSEINLNETNDSACLPRMYHHRPSVNDTIRRVISKLAKASQISLNHHHHHRNHRNPMDMESWQSNNHWSLFNSHTVHNCSQLNRRQYPDWSVSRIISGGNNAAAATTDPGQIQNNTTDANNQQQQPIVESNPETIPLTMNQT